MRWVVSVWLPTWPTDRLRRTLRHTALSADRPYATAIYGDRRRIVGAVDMATRAKGRDARQFYDHVDRLSPAPLWAEVHLRLVRHLLRVREPLNVEIRTEALPQPVDKPLRVGRKRKVERADQFSLPSLIEKQHRRRLVWPTWRQIVPLDDDGPVVIDGHGVGRWLRAEPYSVTQWVPILLKASIALTESLPRRLAETETAMLFPFVQSVTHISWIPRYRMKANGQKTQRISAAGPYGEYRRSTTCRLFDRR